MHRADLNDRCASLNPPTIPASGRRCEAEFWRSFDADYPAIFGGLLNADRDIDHSVGPHYTEALALPEALSLSSEGRDPIAAITSTDTIDSLDWPGEGPGGRA